MAITDKSKLKISEAFENLEEAITNLRKQVSLAGIDGFKRGEIDNIYEMAKLYTNVTDIQYKADKVRPVINGYVLDLAVEKVVANKDKNKQSKVKNRVKDKNGKTVELADEVMVEGDMTIRRMKGELPVYITITDGEKIKASARILSNKKVIISIGSVISDIEDNTISKTNSNRRKKMILDKKVEPLEDGGLKLLEDIKVDSLRIATNIIYGSTLNSVDKLWKTINGITLRDYLDK